MRPGTTNLPRQSSNNSLHSTYSAKNSYGRPDSAMQQMPVQVMPTVLPSSTYQDSRHQMPAHSQSFQQQVPDTRHQPVHAQSYQQQSYPLPVQSQPRPVRPASTAAPGEKQVRATFDFDAENPNELSSNYSVICS